VVSLLNAKGPNAIGLLGAADFGILFLHFSGNYGFSPLVWLNLT